MSVELKPSLNISENESNQGVLALPTAKRNDMIGVLHNNIERNELAPSEVQSALLCSNNFVSDCTSLGGNNTEILIKKLEFADRNNLTNLFSLLLKVNKRNNTNLYK
jgi:hypothetical protein